MRELGKVSGLLPAAGLGHAAKEDNPRSVRQAAQDFEALLIGQILRTVRENGSGWMGSGSGSSADCATEFAEQHVAAVMAAQGGLGLANLIAAGLDHQRESAAGPSAAGHAGTSTAQHGSLPLAPATRR